MPTTLPVPKNDTELAEMLADPARARPVLESTQTLTEFIRSYANRAQGEGTDLQRLVAEETQRQFAEILKANGFDKLTPSDVAAEMRRLNLSNEVPSQRRGWSRNAPGAKLDTKFGTWEDYLRATWAGNTTHEALSARSEIQQIQNAFGSTVPSDGGFLIPERLRADLLKVALEMALVRSRARVVPMDSLTVPYPTIDVTSNASSVHGGIVGYWTEEAGSLTDSAPKFGRVVLQAKKLTLYSEIPNELFQDSIISLDQFMSDSYPEALAWFEDLAFIGGGGVGEPLGFLNADAAVSVTKETNQTAATIVWENIVKMYSRMLPSSIGRAVWVCHIDTFPELATMALSVGTGGSAVWMGNGDGAGAPPMTILGRPVIFTEKVSSVGTAGDVNFVDFGYYLIGDRQQMQSATSTEFKFGNDKTAFRLIQRVDGRPWLNSAITPQTGSNTLSPFVKTATRA
jgi:HK97 family phage major capsid protein